MPACVDRGCVQSVYCGEVVLDDTFSCEALSENTSICSSGTKFADCVNGVCEVSSYVWQGCWNCWKSFATKDLERSIYCVDDRFIIASVVIVCLFSLAALVRMVLSIYHIESDGAKFTPYHAKFHPSVEIRQKREDTVNYPLKIVLTVVFCLYSSGINSNFMWDDTLVFILVVAQVGFAKIMETVLFEEDPFKRVRRALERPLFTSTVFMITQVLFTTSFLCAILLSSSSIQILFLAVACGVSTIVISRFNMGGHKTIFINAKGVSYALPSFTEFEVRCDSVREFLTTIGLQLVGSIDAYEVSDDSDRPTGSVESSDGGGEEGSDHERGDNKEGSRDSANNVRLRKL